jgi:hypothetical protein
MATLLFASDSKHMIKVLATLVALDGLIKMTNFCSLLFGYMDFGFRIYSYTVPATLENCGYAGTAPLLARQLRS